MSGSRAHFDRQRAIWHSSLTALQKLVLLVLNEFVGGGKCEAFPSVATMVRFSSLSVSTVKRTLSDLCDMGVIKRTTRFRKGTREHTTSAITILWDSIPTAEGSVTQTPPSVTQTPPVVSDRHYRSVTVTPQERLKGTAHIERLSERIPADAGEPTEKVSSKELMDHWNATVPFNHIRTMDGRESALKTRNKEPFFVANWREGINKIPSSAFLCGGGRVGWKIDIDFFLKPKSLSKILEGSYHHESKTKPAERTGYGRELSTKPGDLSGT